MSAHPLPAGRLPPGSVYRSPAGRAAFDAAYERILARLPFPVRTQDVPTSFGRTRLTIGGGKTRPPLLVLPGMSITGPRMLEFCLRHIRDRQLIAPDLIGQPGRSDDRVQPIARHGPGRWLVELLDALGIGRADILGASFGAAYGLDLAAIAPDRAGRQVLIMPAGLTPRIPYPDIYRRLVVPWLIYRYLPDRRRLAAIARPLAASLTPEDADYLDIVIRETAFWRHRPAGPFFRRDFVRYREPVLLVTAGRDAVFPRGPTHANAVAALNVVEDIYLAQSTHVPDDVAMAPVHERIAAFLGA